MAYDVARVRESFPALKEGAAHFDGPGGSQVPVQVGDAIAETITAAIANRGNVTAAEQRADAVVADARQAVADLLGAAPDGVVFGRSMTQLTYDISRALAKQWFVGDDVVVTRLDHDANIRPWVRAAELAGANVRWAPFDAGSAQLSVDAVAELVGERTRVVALTGASNLLGTRPDVRAIADVAHAHGALVYVDGVHLTPHAPVDMTALGADFFVCSPYKFLGPHLGALAADADLLATIEPDKLLPATDDVPERFELGTLPYELLAGTTAAVDFLADLVPTTGRASSGRASSGRASTGLAGDGDRRQRLVASMSALEAYEDGLFQTLLAGLRAIDGVTLHGSPAHRTPTALFSVAGRSPQEVYERLALDGVNAPGGNFYALEASRWLGLGDEGAVRAGLAPYSDASDIERLVAGVAACAERSK